MAYHYNKCFNKNFTFTGMTTASFQTVMARNWAKECRRPLLAKKKFDVLAVRIANELDSYSMYDKATTSDFISIDPLFLLGDCEQEGVVRLDMNRTSLGSKKMWNMYLTVRTRNVPTILMESHHDARLTPSLAYQRCHQRNYVRNSIKQFLTKEFVHDMTDGVYHLGRFNIALEADTDAVQIVNGVLISMLDTVEHFCMALFGFEFHLDQVGMSGQMHRAFNVESESYHNNPLSFDDRVKWLSFTGEGYEDDADLGIEGMKIACFMKNISESFGGCYEIYQPHDLLHDQIDVLPTTRIHIPSFASNAEVVRDFTEKVPWLIPQNGAESIAIVSSASFKMERAWFPYIRVVISRASAVTVQSHVGCGVERNLSSVAGFSSEWAYTNNTKDWIVPPISATGTRQVLFRYKNEDEREREILVNNFYETNSQPALTVGSTMTFFAKNTLGYKVDVFMSQYDVDFKSPKICNLPQFNVHGSFMIRANLDGAMEFLPSLIAHLNFDAFLRFVENSLWDTPSLDSLKLVETCLDTKDRRKKGLLLPKIEIPENLYFGGRFATGSKTVLVRANNVLPIEPSSPKWITKRRLAVDIPESPKKKARTELEFEPRFEETSDEDADLMIGNQLEYLEEVSDNDEN